ncbi:hypothetical protein E4T56_gene2600, partial [Termitomyces sp. T112]
LTKKGKTSTEQEKSKDIGAVEDTVDVEVEKAEKVENNFIIGELFENVEVVNGKPIESIIKVEAEWVEEIEVDVGEFFELVEKVEAKARSSAEKHKDHTEEAEVSKEKAIGKVESTIASEETAVIASNVSEVSSDVGKAAETAEQAMVVEGVMGNVVKVASEVKHAEKKIEETTHKEVVEQVLSKEEVKAVIKANKNGVLVEIVKQKIEVIAEVEKKATRKCHMQCRKQE